MNNVANPLLQIALYEKFISISPELVENQRVFTSARIADYPKLIGKKMINATLSLNLVIFS